MNSIKLDQAVSQQVFNLLSKASLESLQAGSVLQGRVQSLENGLLFIKLLDGASFTAQVPEGFSAQPGELISLEIGERKNDQLTAKVVNTETRPITPKEAPPLEHTLSRDLSAMGAPPTDKLITDALNLIKADPSLPLDQAAFLTANGMENQPEMLKVLQKISEQEFHLHHNLNTLKDGLVQGLKEAGTQTRQILEPLIVSQKAQELSSALDMLLSGHTPEQKQTVLNTLHQLLSKVSPGTPEEPGTPLTTQETADQFIRSGASLEKALNGAEVLESFKNGTQELLKPQEAEHLLKLVQNSLEDLHIQSDRVDKGDASEIKKVLDKFFDKAIIEAENGKIEETDLNSKTKALKEIMEFSQKTLQRLDGASQDRALPVLKEIDQALRFFNQVVTYDAMIQLPLKINRQNTTGELYVMKRKKGRKKIDGENFTLFLSLRTISLGRIESFLNASRKVITVSFRVEQEELVKLVKENHRALYDSLLKKGYKLAELKCRVLDTEESGPLNAARKAQEALGLDARVDLKI